MNALKYILGFYLMAMPISEVQPFYTQSNSKNNIEQTELKNNSTFTLKKVSKCTQNTNFEYTNPFTALKRKGTMSSEGTNSKLNTNTINITKKTVLSGLVLFNHEDSIREKYAKLIGFDIDWRFIHNAPYSSKIRDSVIKEFTQQNSYLTAKQG